MNEGSHYIRFLIWRILNRQILSHQQQADNSEHQIVLVRSRQAKVLVALVVSMAVGMIFLKALGYNPPPAGAFCLAQYNQLVPVEEVISSHATQSSDRWNRIQVYYSGTKSGDIQLALLAGRAATEDINCHFVICNGLGGGDGQIQRTEKWERQWPVNYESPDCEPQIANSGQTIYICVIADGKNAHPTEFQIKRTEALVNGLCGRFDIHFGSIYYPSDWR